MLDDFAKQNKVIVGMTRARRFEELDAETLKNVPFVNYTAEERMDPLRTLENAKTVICLGYPYPHEITIDRGISIAASGVDYHILVKNCLEKMMTELGINGLAFSDTGPLVDRHVAYLCGLGHYGKNGFIVNENFGTLFFIGYIITDEPADEYSVPSNGTCGDCRRCLDACPTGAISGKKMAYESCLSYLTQLKGKLTLRQMKSMGGRVYGCDVCQLSCPKNKGKIKITLREKGYAHFFDMSNKAFKEKYGSTGIAWRGRAAIVRNAVIAAVNTGIDKDKAEKFLNDENEVLRYTAETLFP